jgi:hypothetical protein
LEKVANELESSIKRIENEVNKPVISFAYPNGGSADFSPEITKLVGEAGIKAAFTLLPGPVSYASIRKNPLVIRRVFIMYRDTLSRFILKLSGLSRLLRW